MRPFKAWALVTCPVGLDGGPRRNGLLLAAGSWGQGFSIPPDGRNDRKLVGMTGRWPEYLEKGGVIREGRDDGAAPGTPHQV